ncbi:s00954 pol polyprotein transposon 1731 [Lasius niger]|uniref:S00954 pol polyprotein transposon 1731 n=1 Tax=Lasius niger TaxID=67767 RepID=A0A0J7K7L7_LASNI|nr:s00954 pol polyprotein transposon 1731 [Lasius niger]
MSGSSDDADTAGCEEPHITINLLNIRGEDEEVDQDDEEATNEEGEPESASRRSPGRPRIVRTGLPGRPRKVHGAANYADEEDDFAFLSEIPVARAMANPESAEWTRAMADEVKSILRKDT